MRVLNRLLAVTIGLLLASAAVITAVEAVLLAAGQPPWLVPRATWDRHLGQATWSSSTLQTAAVAMLAVGGLLLLAQLVPRRPVRLRGGGAPGREVWFTRRGLQRRMAWTADRHEAATPTGIVVRRARLVAHVTVPEPSSTGDLRQDIATRLGEDLDHLGVHLRRSPVVRVKAASEREGARLR